MTRLRLIFSECEHYGDLNNYTGDIIKCGGKILQQELDEEEEAGNILTEVLSIADFLDQFKKTESFAFLETYY